MNGIVVVMDDLGQRHTPDLPTRALDPDTPVNFFTIDEKLVVQPANLLRRLAPDHQVCA